MSKENKKSQKRTGNFWQENKKVIFFILTGFVLWQILIFAVGGFSGSFLPTRKTFLYAEASIKSPKILWNRANFDGVHYLYISRYGYGLYQQAFFPLYPQLIKKAAPLFGGKDLLAAVFISNISFLLALFLFFRLIRLDYKEEVSFRTIIFFLLFPTAFFFGMAYTEGLFLMLILGSFYAARRGQWWWAGILGGLATYTRLVGIFLFPALVYEWYQQNQFSIKKSAARLLSLALIPAGLLTYMGQLWKSAGDPLLFFHVQPYFGAQRSGNKIILLYQVFWRYFKMALTTKWDFLYFTVWLEILTAVVFLVLLILAFRGKIRRSYLIFSLLAFLAPTFFGTFSSLPRYVLVLFPCFIYLGTKIKKKTAYLLGLVLAIFLIICASLFSQGYWIS
jgi:Gpi18-like mannosyltransferase